MARGGQEFKKVRVGGPAKGQQKPQDSTDCEWEEGKWGSKSEGLSRGLQRYFCLLMTGLIWVLKQLFFKLYTN